MSEFTPQETLILALGEILDSEVIKARRFHGIAQSLYDRWCFEHKPGVDALNEYEWQTIARIVRRYADKVTWGAACEREIAGFGVAA